MPSFVVPAFCLYASEKRANNKNWLTATEIAVDVALTFSGVGNLAKLKYLRSIYKVSKLKAATTVLGGAEVISGIAGFITNYTCADSDSEFCKKFETVLVFIDIATLSADVVLNAVGENTEAYQNALSAERLAKGTNSPSQFKFKVDLHESIGYGYKRPAGTPNYVLTGQRLTGDSIKIDNLTKIEVRYKLNRTTDKYEINTMFPIE